MPKIIQRRNWMRFIFATMILAVILFGCAQPSTQQEPAKTAAPAQTVTGEVTASEVDTAVSELGELDSLSSDLESLEVEDSGIDESLFS